MKRQFPRTGTIAIVGKPNVGKSTLLNSILGIRLSIATHKPQTTRHKILGVKTTNNCQYIYLDTPGFHKGYAKALNKYMNKTAIAAITTADVVLMLLHAGRFTAQERILLDKISQTSAPVLAVVNKTDLFADKQLLLPFIEMLAQQFNFAEIVPISAKKKQGIEHLEQVIANYLPAGDFIYQSDEYTDKNMRFLAAERVREQLFLVMQKEIPYSLSVEIERFETSAQRHVIGAVIWVERASQKGMVIGKNGAILKEVGKRARKSMMALFGENVHLELWVRVKQGWADNDKALASLGYYSSK